MKNIPVGKIGFDFDGVIADIGEAFVRLACEEYGCCSFDLEDITSFDVEECIDISSALVTRIFTDILVDSVRCGVRPMSGVENVLPDLCRAGTVHVVTARSLEKPVTDWFDAFFPFEVCDRISLTVTGDHDDKARYIKQLGLDYFIDDRTVTCHQLDRENIGAIVYTQPWNRGQHSLPSVDGWQEIGRLLDIA